ncbi:MAG: iron-sulfur cluster assembly accessory protein [Elainellaceae cyanobacterium]
MIYITDAATRELRRLEQQQGLQDAYLIVEVSGGGCLNLSYCLNFNASVPPGYIEASSTSLLSGAVKHTERPQAERGVAIAPSARPHVTGLRIDYSEDLLGGGFRFHNPNAVSTCGCGHSFSIATPISTVQES